LTVVREDAPQREHPLRAVFNGLRCVLRTGCQWRYMPDDLPPWHTLVQQAPRWSYAGASAAMVHGLRILMHKLAVRNPQPSAAIFVARPCHRRRRWRGATAGAPATMVHGAGNDGRGAGNDGARRRQ
jgi:transposase